MFALIALLVLYQSWLAILVEGNLVDSQNVFGWQKQKQKHSSSRSASAAAAASHRRLSTPSSTSISPLRRSKNVFGWQEPKKLKHHDTTKLQHRRSNEDDIHKTIVQASTNSYSDEELDYDQSKQQHLNISPNIKLQPRKKELWLPWPLGALRNDFYKFAAEQRQYGSQQARREWHPRSSSQQQQQIRSYYSGDYEGYQEQNINILHQGREWATKMLRRGEAMLPFGRHHANQNDDDSMSHPKGDSYWVRETTTPMATASATIQKNGKKKQKHQNGIGSGGESKEEDNDKFDKHVMFQYLKLQASVRLRQLGYGELLLWNVLNATQLFFN